MKRLILAIILFIFCIIALFSCNEQRDDNGKKVVNGFQIVTLEGCKYALYFYGSIGVSMVHAGNCNNPIHQK